VNGRKPASSKKNAGIPDGRAAVAGMLAAGDSYG